MQAIVILPIFSETFLVTLKHCSFKCSKTLLCLASFVNLNCPFFFYLPFRKTHKKCNNSCQQTNADVQNSSRGNIIIELFLVSKIICWLHTSSQRINVALRSFVCMMLCAAAQLQKLLLIWGGFAFWLGWKAQFGSFASHQ